MIYNYCIGFYEITLTAYHRYVYKFTKIYVKESKVNKTRKERCEVYEKKKNE